MKIIFIFVFLFSIQLFPQSLSHLKPSEKITFEHLNEDDGLSNNHVTCILQDSKGYMWIGTKKGLNKYDGYNLTTYIHDPFNKKSLGDNFITTLFEDKNGKLWIGTKRKKSSEAFSKGQFYKYNRETDNFKKYVVNGMITSIADDSSGMMLIGTKAGIYIFNTDTQKFDLKYINEKKVEDISNRVNYIHRTKHKAGNTIWVGTERGLFKSDNNLNKFTVYKPKKDASVSISGRGIQSISNDKFGNIWIGTQVGGLNKFDINTNKFYRYKFDENNINSLSHDNVLAILNDYSGYVWIGTNKGLNKYDPENNRFIRYYHDPTNPSSFSGKKVTAIYEDNSGVIWIGTIESGINKINKQFNQFTHYNYDQSDQTSLGSSIIRSIYQDSEGRIWIGTIKGIDKFDVFNEKFIHHNNTFKYPYKISSNLVWSIEEDNMKNLWIGTFIGGLNKFNPKTGKFKHFKHKSGVSNCISHNSIRTIFKDSNGMFWIGTNGGLNRFDPKNEKFIQYKNNPKDPNTISHNRVVSICETENEFWIGTQGGGVNKFNPKTEKFKSYKNDPDNPHSLSNNNIWSVYNDRSGEIWVSTQDGLNLYNKNNDNFKKYTFDKDSLAINLSKVIFEDRSDNLWIGNNRGLFQFDQLIKEFIHYGKEDNIPELNIDAILEDDNGYLWLLNEKYLIKFNPKTETTNTFKLNNGLNIPSGFKSANLKCQDGKLIFSGLNGFVFFDPDAIQDNANNPNIVLTDFQLFNKSVDINKNDLLENENIYLLDRHISESEIITIPYDKDVFSIEFASLDFRDPTKNKYAYKLDGVDPEWVYTDASRRFATYNQLNPGEYIFHVKGTNNDGVWNEEGKSLKIIITPLWWQTTIFKIFVILIVIGIVAWIFYYRLNALKKKHQEQEEFSRKLIDSQEMDRKRIASALHDSHGQNLLVISNEMQYFTKEHDEYKSDLQPVTEIIQESIDEIRNISYALHPHQLDKLGLVKTIKSMINKVSGSTDVKFELNIDNVDDLFEKKVEINIYRIIQEATNNIIRHAEASKANIEIKKNFNSVELIIKDNGIGFNKEEKLRTASGLGLSGMHERVNLINGKYKLTSEKENGTAIEIRIPFKA